MGVKLLTFLGKNKLNPCEYMYKGQKLTKTEFVQEALVEALQKIDGFENIEFIIFLTEEARLNWEINGLKEKVSNLINPNKPHEIDIKIPENREENEFKKYLWDVFSQIIGQLDDGDEIIFDITNSFRYQPMLALLALHFAKVTRNIKIHGIYYASDQTNPPAIIDLTSFIDMQEWITNIYAFEKSGRAQPLMEWVQQKEDEMKQRNDQEQLEHMRSRKEFIKDLHALTLALETNRGRELGKLAKQALSSLNKVKNQHDLFHSGSFKPLEILLNRIEDKILPLATGNQISSGLAAVRWCVDHGLIQQAYTMLDEITLIAICKVVGFQDEEILSYRNKQKISEAVRKLSSQKKDKRKHPIIDKKRLGDMKEKVDNLLSDKQTFVDSFSNLKDDRNDLNHAGFSLSPLTSEEFIQNIKRDSDKNKQNSQTGKYEKLIELVDHFWQEHPSK